MEEKKWSLLVTRLILILSPPFSHPRSTLNDFYIAELLLNKIVKKVIPNKLFSTLPLMIIHPMEKSEGGLTAIEVRAFQGLSFRAGARDIAVYQGKDTLDISTIVFDDIKQDEQSRRNKN